MNLRDIALKNIQRRKGKAVLVMTGMLLSVTAVVSVVMYSESMKKNIKEQIEKYGANIIITPKSDTLQMNFGGIDGGNLSYNIRTINEKDVKKISSIKDSKSISALGSFVMGPVTVKGKAVILSGIEMNKIASLRPWWKLNIPDEGTGVKRLISGARAAEYLGLKTGSKVRLGNEMYKVHGVIEKSGSQDDDLLFTDLANAQKILDRKGLINFIEVAALCSACPIDDMVKQISGVLPGADVTAVRKVIESRMNSVGLYNKFLLSVIVLVIMISMLAVITTMLNSIRDRAQDIGIMRAAGFRKTHIMKIIFTESFLLSSVSGVLGYFAGYFLTLILISVLYSESDTKVIFDGFLLLNTILVTTSAGLIASIYPAYRASNLDPAYALKHL